METTQEPQATVTPAKQRPGIRLLRVLALTLLVLVGSAVALTAWAIWSETGARKVLALAQDLSLGSLQFDGVNGRLRDHLQIANLRYQSPTVQVQAQALDLQWSPESLANKRLQIHSLQASSLRIASVGSPDSDVPPQLPQSLELPIAVQIDQLALAHLKIASLDAHGKQISETGLTALSGQLSADQHSYHAQAAVSSPWGHVQARASLATQKPYALQAGVNYQGQPEKTLPPIAIDSQLQGSLQEFTVQGHILAGDDAQNKTAPRGQFSVTVLPFAALPLRAASLDLQQVNPASFSAAAPQADLNIVLQMMQETGKTEPVLNGSLKFSNGAAGSWDKQQLPVQSIQSRLRWNAQALTLQELALQLPGGGTISGDAAISFAREFQRLPQIQGKLALDKVDLAKLDQRIHSTTLHGSVEVQTEADKQINLQVALSDPLASLKADASYLFGNGTGDLVKLKSLDLHSADSGLQARGELNLGAQNSFQMQGSLQHFNPARWVQVPAGNLSADIQAKGQLKPELTLALQLSQLHGEFAGQALAGAVDAQLQQGSVLQIKKFDVQWGQTQLAATGIWGQAGQQLQFRLDAPDLRPWSVLVKQDVRGSLKLDGALTGKLSEPAGNLHVQAQELAYGTQYKLARMDGQFALASGLQGGFNGDLHASDLQIAATDGKAPAENLLQQASLKLHGTRQAHQIDLDAIFDASHHLSMQASGALVSDAQHAPGWNGTILGLQHKGRFNYQLAAPVPLSASAHKLSLGDTSLRGNLGDIVIHQLEWTPDSLKTSGSVKSVAVVELLNMFKPQERWDGNLLLDASWQIQMQDGIQGEVSIQRQAGDLRLLDTEGNAKPLSSGLKELKLSVLAGGVVPGSDGDRVSAVLTADGAKIGHWQASASTVISHRNGVWGVADNAPLQGKLLADVPDLQWLGSWINPGLSLKGKLHLDAGLGGVRKQPDLHASLNGRDLEVAFASEGLLLPNGSFDAKVDGTRIELQQLQFSNSVSTMPRHEQFRDVKWIGQTGDIKATGNMDLKNESGDIKVVWDKFPLLQRSDRWLLVSGQANLTQAKQIWTLGGKLTADGAYFKLPKLPPPSLSSDVVLSSQKVSDDSSKSGLQTRVDFVLDMGPRFVFVGRGLDTTLAGDIRLRSNNAAPTQASGSIHTVGGVYEGYGQQLGIERGILNFQGAPDNPGLNILAYRRGLAVEAGVEVTGTVAAPKVKLASEPDVPDAEKLSWLVLGRGSDQLAGGDASLLMSAAGAIFGGDGSRNVPRDIVQGLGFDEFSVGADNGSSSHLPSQTIAGATATGTATTPAQMVSVGKRLAPGLVLSVERGLTDASGALKLSWQLTRRVSVVARTGTDSSVDAFYTFSFH